MKRLWVTDALAANESIPAPHTDEPLPSGKWVQRVPRSLHQKLARLAEEEGVSLNQLVTGMLAEQLGVRTTRRSIEQIVEQKVAAYLPQKRFGHSR
jgi:antitoxin HicB